MMRDHQHNRGEVLRAVIDAAGERRDGLLPVDVPGVQAAFSDTHDLMGALLIRWHTRLAAQIERELFEEPVDLEAAVIRGWCRTRDQLVGIRLIIDTLTSQRISPDLAAQLRTTAHKDWSLMAVMAGQAGYQDEIAISVGRRIEAKARQILERPAEVLPPAKPMSLLARIRAALAA